MMVSIGKNSRGKLSQCSSLKQFSCFKRVQSHQWLKHLLLQWLTCQAPDVIGSALGLVGPAPVYPSLGETESPIFNFYLCVATRMVAWAAPSLRYTSMMLGPISKTTPPPPKKKKKNPNNNNIKTKQKNPCALHRCPSPTIRQQPGAFLWRCIVVSLRGGTVMTSIPSFCLRVAISSGFLPPRWSSGKASASRAEDLGFESRWRRDFFGVESYQWLKNWHSSGYPARRLVL